MDVLGLGWIEINNWFLLLIVLSYTAYLYLTWDFNFFEKRGIPGPKPVPIFGTIYRSIKEGYQTVDVIRGKKYGKVYGIFVGSVPTLIISDPDMIRDVLIKNHDRRNFVDGGKVLSSMLAFKSGDDWKTLRSTLSPTFSTGKLKQMTQQMNECAQNLVENLTKEADSGNHLECKEYAGAFSMDLIASVAFGLKLDSQKDKNHKFVQTAKNGLALSGAPYLQLLLLLFPFLQKVRNLLGLEIASEEVIGFFGDVTNQIIETRKEPNQTRNDLMQLMLNVHNEPTSNNTEHDKDFYNQHANTAKRQLTKTEIMAQGILFFIAGYDTTATTLSFMMYALALNPAIQEKLNEEILKVASNKEIDYDVLAEMPLLDMCVQESLRMYPPIIRTSRECSDDTVIKGIKIEKGQAIMIPIYALHHDPDIWPDPEVFNPYRFTKEEKAKHTSFDWIPFGGGPRNCIAMRLALTEVKIAAAHIVKNYKLLRGPKTEVPLTFKLSRIVLNSLNGLWIQIEKR